MSVLVHIFAFTSIKLGKNLKNEQEKRRFYTKQTSFFSLVLHALKKKRNKLNVFTMKTMVFD